MFPFSTFKTLSLLQCSFSIHLYLPLLLFLLFPLFLCLYLFSYSYFVNFPLLIINSSLFFFDFPFFFFLSLTLPIISIQSYYSLIPLLNAFRLAFWLHESLLDFPIYFLLKLFPQWFFFIFTISYCPSELLYILLHYPTFLFHLLQFYCIPWLIFFFFKLSFYFFQKFSYCLKLYTYYTCSSTVVFLIFILKYCLYSITNPEISYWMFIV